MHAAAACCSQNPGLYFAHNSKRSVCTFKVFEFLPPFFKIFFVNQVIKPFESFKTF